MVYFVLWGHTTIYDAVYEGYVPFEAVESRGGYIGEGYYCRATLTQTTRENLGTTVAEESEGRASASFFASSLLKWADRHCMLSVKYVICGDSACSQWCQWYITGSTMPVPPPHFRRKYLLHYISPSTYHTRSTILNDFPTLHLPATVILISWIPPLFSAILPRNVRPFCSM